MTTIGKAPKRQRPLVGMLRRRADRPRQAPVPTPSHSRIDTPVHELPLPPITRGGVRQLWDFVRTSAGAVGDTGYKGRELGEVFRLALPNLPKPLNALGTTFIDNYHGETYFVTSPRLVRELYTMPPGMVDQEAQKKFTLFAMGAQSPFVLGGPGHRDVRRALVPELTTARVTGHRERIVRVLDTRIDRLPLHTPVSLYEFYAGFAQEVILRVVFGMDGGRELDEYRAALHEADSYYLPAKSQRRLIGFFLNAFASPELRNGPAELSQRNDVPSKWISPEGYRIKKYADTLIQRKIDEFRDQPNDSIASRLVAHAASAETPWSDKKLRDTITALLVAGQVTSVSAYEWATQYLMHNPGPRAKLVDEARAGRTERYAQAVNTEALRLKPPIWGLLPFPVQDIALGGYRVRKNSFIFVRATAVHHDEELYPEPALFRPERFLEHRPDPYGFIAFGAGRHRCPGSAFYLAEASLVLHRMFGRLELEPCLPDVDRSFIAFATLTRPYNGTEVIVRRREAADAVPWCRHDRQESDSPLQDALAPTLPTSDEPARCPFPHGGAATTEASTPPTHPPAA